MPAVGYTLTGKRTHLVGDVPRVSLCGMRLKWCYDAQPASFDLPLCPRCAKHTKDQEVR